MTAGQKEDAVILIVDDEMQNVQVVGSVLSSFGYDFMVARDGEEALERVRAKTPDLILLDIRMPKMDGFEACRRFREMEGMEEVPVIFLSANDDRNTIVRALEEGGVDYITKPFNKAELLARVRTHVELKTIRDERVNLIQNTERFLEMMAHDLKNWVGSAHFSAQLLAGLPDLPDKASRAAGTIEDSTGQALEFIGEVLTNAREAKAEVDLRIRSFSAGAVCRELVSLLEPMARKKNIDLEFEQEEGADEITTDRVALRRILENLVTNAVKFSPPGSRVEIRVAANPTRIEVRDEGPGFSPEDREHLFEPYKRLSARPTGGEVSTGLGLAIVRQLCDQLELGLRIEEADPGARIIVGFENAVTESGA